ncbi:MAG: hypothetical protein ACOYT4_05210, partial [Nanoarchaeota archaeon]
RIEFTNYSYCGDGICNAEETCEICSEDCGSCYSGSGSSSGGGSFMMKVNNTEQIINEGSLDKNDTEENLTIITENKSEIENKISDHNIKGNEQENFGKEKIFIFIGIVVLIIFIIIKIKKN